MTQVVKGLAAQPEFDPWNPHNRRSDQLLQGAL